MVQRAGRWALLVVVVLVAGLIGPTASMSTALISTDSCGQAQTGLPAGPMSVSVVNHGPVFASVYLIDPANLVFAEIPAIGPGATLPLSTTLGAGTYQLRCVFTNGVVRNSATFAVTGTARGAVAGYRPLPDLDLAGPVTAYRKWVGAALPGLLADCQRLAADVTAGNLASAQAGWLTAHLDYERLGAAYNSFGDFDDAIDGRDGGLPQGPADPDWTGFHAVEYALWHGGTSGAARQLTAKLVASVQGLMADFRSEEVDPGDLPLRAHEILENTLEFQLTGLADYGSGTVLATAYANTQGTQEVLSVLTPLITPRAPHLLPTVQAGLAQVRRDLLAARSPTGTWSPPGALPAETRQRIDGDLGGLLEQLAVLPNLLAPRTSG
jgi:high-affinity iron transporter